MDAIDVLGLNYFVDLTESGIFDGSDLKPGDTVQYYPLSASKVIDGPGVCGNCCFHARHTTTCELLEGRRAKYLIDICNGQIKYEYIDPAH